MVAPENTPIISSIDLANKRINIGMTHKGTVQLESERLTLRQFTEEDAEAAFKNWFSDEDVAKFMSWDRYTSLESVQDLLNRFIRSYRSPQFYQWAIVSKEIREAVGTIGTISQSESTAKVQLGYCIGSQWRNQGFASEALSTVIPFFFDEVHVYRIEGFHEPNNPVSGKVMQKCGLQYEGTLRAYFRNERGLVDACMYSILQDDYFKMQYTTLS